MKRLTTFALALLILATALPASAAATASVTIVNASTATWTGTAELALVQEAQAAIVWKRERMALIGAIFTAALPNLTVVDHGDGTGSIVISMPRAGAVGFDAWASAFADSHCEPGTVPERLQCVADKIKADVRQCIHEHKRYLHSLEAPAEPDF